MSDENTDNDDDIDASSDDNYVPKVDESDDDDVVPDIVSMTILSASSGVPIDFEVLKFDVDSNNDFIISEHDIDSEIETNDEEEPQTEEGLE
ncbi:unnamed protein product [Diabrotica balteata]|uniref:Uncharacterized protein n=1 Tax=Diabrotica balteata TaxID=107213 RepID=A0A9N9T3Y3_DIABA|nr:unnamed protein product [Diabrotica balteata]